ncbi:MAG: PAS domain S-box protein, partial [Chitinivibrionales bacterium]|nr:PAS domain S-box protein [Chitinivibrionales bacterium]
MKSLKTSKKLPKNNAITFQIDDYINHKKRYREFINFLGETDYKTVYPCIVADYTPDHLLLLTKRGDIIYGNHAFPGLWEKSPHTGVRCYDFLLPGIKHVLQKNIKTVCQTKKRLSFEFCLVTDRNESNYFEFKLNPLFDKKRAVGVIARITNITERKLAENALIENENRHRMLIETLNEGICLIDHHYAITYVNKVLSKLLNCTPTDLQGKLFFDIIDQRSLKMARKNITLHSASEKPIDLKLVSKNGSSIDVTLTHVPVHMNNKLYSKLITILDISERKILELQLLQSQQELRKLTSHIQTTRERERTAIAREIHDELGQTLTALKINLSYLFNTNTIEAKFKNDTLNLITKALTTVNHIIRTLRPPLLLELGLKAALEWCITDFQSRSGINCNSYFKFNDKLLNIELSLAIYRVLQESLTNILRHAHASQVYLKIIKTGFQLQMTISDNGIGIKPHAIQQDTSYGLIGMRERILSFGGILKITS